MISEGAEKERSEIFDESIVTLLCALVGSRIGFVLVNWQYYGKHIWEILKLQEGGLTWSGAFLGGILGLCLCTTLYHLSFGLLLDRMIKLWVIIYAAAWLGSIFEGCSYGGLSDEFWAIPVRDESGMIAKRFPLQILAALVSITWYWLLENWHERSEKSSWIHLPGTFGFIVLAGLLIQILCLSLLRADPSPVYLGWRFESLIALGFCLISIFALLQSLKWMESSIIERKGSKTRSM